MLTTIGRCSLLISTCLNIALIVSHFNANPIAIKFSIIASIEYWSIGQLEKSYDVQRRLSETISSESFYGLYYILLQTAAGAKKLKTPVHFCSFYLNRFCPSVFFYLLTIVPCVWILELDRLDDRLKAREAFMKGLNYTPEVVQNNLPGFKNMTIFNKASI